MLLKGRWGLQEGELGHATEVIGQLSSESHRAQHEAHNKELAFTHYTLHPYPLCRTGVPRPARQSRGAVEGGIQRLKSSD